MWKHSIFCSHGYWATSRAHFHKANTGFSCTTHTREKPGAQMAFTSLLVLIMSDISREAHRGSGVCTHNLMHLCKNVSVCPAIVNLNPLSSRCTCFIPNKMNSELFKRFNFARCPIQCRRSILSPDNRHLYWNINHVHSFWVALHTN